MLANETPEISVVDQWRPTKSSIVQLAGAYFQRFYGKKWKHQKENHIKFGVHQRMQKNMAKLELTAAVFRSFFQNTQYYTARTFPP